VPSNISSSSNNGSSNSSSGTGGSSSSSSNSSSRYPRALLSQSIYWLRLAFRMPGIARGFPLLPDAQTASEAHPTSNSRSTVGLFVGSRAAGP